MKKIYTAKKFFVTLFILSFTMITLGMFVSCVQSPGPNDKVNKIESETIYFDEGGYIYGMDVYKFEYKGHKYIRFGSYDYQTIVHDPDCKCHKGNNTNNTLFDW